VSVWCRRHVVRCRFRVARRTPRGQNHGRLRPVLDIWARLAAFCETGNQQLVSQCKNRSNRGYRSPNS
jgi:hypothetical protein